MSSNYQKSWLQRLNPNQKKGSNLQAQRAISQADSSNAYMKLHSGLCQKCRDIDLYQLFIGKEHEVYTSSPEGKSVVELECSCGLSLGSVGLERFTYGCDLCKFFLALLPSRTNESLGIADAGPGGPLITQSDDEDVPYFRGQLAITSHCKYLSISVVVSVLYLDGLS
jgi:hypothetical protein